MTKPTKTRTTAFAVVALACLGLTACTSDDPANAPTTTVPAATSTPPATSSAPTSSTSTPAPPTSTSLDPMNQAYVDAEKSYRAFIASYAQAAKTWDAGKVDKKTASGPLIKVLAQDFKKLEQVKNLGGHIEFTQDIKVIKGSKFEPGKIAQLRVCAVTNSRFIDKNGKDVTVDPQGVAKPRYTEARSNEIELISEDGGRTWLVNKLVTGGGVGDPC